MACCLVTGKKKKEKICIFGFEKWDKRKRAFGLKEFGGVYSGSCEEGAFGRQK